MPNAWANRDTKPHTSAYFSEGRCVWPSVPKATGLLDCMHGLGDTLYQRAFIRQYPGAYVLSPWPQLLSDLDVHVVEPSIWLHYTTAPKDIYSKTPPWLEELDRIQFWYYPDDLETIPPYTITASFDRRTARTRQPGELRWDLPPLPKSRHPGCAFVRPVSARGQHTVPSRACDPDYLKRAAKHLKDAGYTVVTASFAKDGSEINFDPPDADHAYLNGELTVLELLALVREAALCIGPVSWYVPAVWCAGTPSAVIMGGYQKHNSPEQLVDARQPATNITWFQTDAPCKCSDMQHQCDKTITDFDDKFSAWVRQNER